MSEPVTKFTMRAPSRQLAEIDRLAAANGYRTRAKFLIAAGLNYDSCDSDEAVVRELSRIVYKLHHLSRAQKGQMNLLKDTDIHTMMGDVRSTMRRVVAGLGR